MKRRSFNRVATAALFGSLTSGRLVGAEPADQRDQYGGWKGISFDATGFFRTQHDGKRWWLVTPEGNVFLSLGINHLHSDLWRQEFNRDAWRKRLAVDDLKNWNEFAPALRRWFLGVCREWGFNTVGVHNSLNVINKPRPALPYMRPITFVDIPHWKAEIPDRNFLDVFEAGFERRCDQLAKSAAAPDDPFLLGYTMTDCPLFTDEDCRERTDVIGGARRKSRIGWPRRLRNLGASAAGKAAYVQTMRDLYHDRIEDFNLTYATKYDSFNALATAENWRVATDLSNGNETRDNVEFLKRVVAKYYQTARDAIRRHDPNHMFLGDKLNANTDTIDTVLPITSQYTDVVMYQMYGRYEVQKPGLDRWAKKTNQPFINGDSAFTMITRYMPRPYGPVADSLQQRAEWTAEFFLKAFSRSDFVGWHYCGLIDATQQVPRKQSRQHSGLLNGFGEPYPALLTTIKRGSDQLYDIGRIDK